MSGRSGSGPFGAEAQICWLGQPAQEAAVPACWDSGPGQCSGVGATREEEGSCSREGGIVRRGLGVTPLCCLTEGFSEVG